MTADSAPRGGTDTRTGPSRPPGRRRSGPIRLRTVLVALAVAAGIACVAAPSAGAAPGEVAVPPAGADPGEAVTAFNSVITLDRHGDLEVTETIRYRFAGSGHHGIERAPSVASGVWRTATDVTVSSPTGAPVQTTLPGQNDRFPLIRVGDPNRTVSGEQTYVLHYTVKGALDPQLQPDPTQTVQLYFDVTGRHWSVPVEEASVRVIAPQPAVSATCNPACTPSTSHDAVSASSGPLTPGNGMGLSIRYPATTVSLGSGGPLGWFFNSGAALITVVAVGGAGVMLSPARRRIPQYLRELRRNPAWMLPAVRHPVPVVAAPRNDAQPDDAHPDAGRHGVPAPPPAGPWPPTELTPAVVGTLLAGRPIDVAVPATLLDLAVRGYLRIEEVPGSAPGEPPQDWRFVLTRPGAELLPHEQSVLDLAFEGRPQVSLAERSRRGWAGRWVTEQLTATGMEHGWFTPSRLPRIGQVLATVGAAAALLLWSYGALTLQFFSRPAFFLGLGFGGFLVVGWLSGWFARMSPTSVTEAGVAAAAGLAGYRDQLAAPDLAQVGPDQVADVFSRSLPYAVAVGLDRSWLDAFAGRTAPWTGSTGWYRPVDAADGQAEVAANLGRFLAVKRWRPPAGSSGGSSGSSWSSSGSSSSSSSGGSSGGGSSGGSW